MTHTPGPWKLVWHGNEAYPFPLSVHTEDDDCWIARDGEVSSEANARIIAAAPELLEALEAMMVMADQGPHPRKLNDALIWKENDELAWSLARAAIARARD